MSDLLLMSDELRAMIGGALEPEQPEADAPQAAAEPSGVTIRVECDIVRIERLDGAYRITFTVQGDGRAEAARLAQVSRPERLWLVSGSTSFDCLCTITAISLRVSSPSEIWVEAVPS